MDAKTPTPADRATLLAHIAALETALARYAAKYGTTDEVRRLLARMQD